jgi:hypothetical protein
MKIKVPLPSSHANKTNWKNTVITVTFEGRNLAGAYLSPKFLAIRPDIVWADLVKMEEQRKE